MIDYFNPEEVGKRIKEAREKAHLTQNELHNITGISITQISSFENGNKNIGLLSLKRIADATNSTMDEIYCGTSSKKPIFNSKNKGELIVNCITALYDEKVIAKIETQIIDEFTMDYTYESHVDFCSYRYN